MHLILLIKLGRAPTRRLMLRTLERTCRAEIQANPDLLPIFAKRVINFVLSLSNAFTLFGKLHVADPGVARVEGRRRWNRASLSVIAFPLPPGLPLI